MRKLLLALLVTAFCLPAGKAYANAAGDPTAIDDKAHVREIDDDRNLWTDALDLMTEQFSSYMMLQTLVIGAFMDGKEQLQTQRLWQDLDNQAHKEYQTDTQMCIFGTNIRSLAMSDQKSLANTSVLSNVMLSRDLLVERGETGQGTTGDLRERVSQYVKTYCDPKDNHNQLGTMCKNPPADKTRYNRDVDFTRLVDGPLTLDVDFTNTDLSHDEEDILAMSRNLFGHRVIDFVPEDKLRQGPIDNMGPGMWILQQDRSLQAIRGVAQNSFSHIVGMKAKGGAQVHDYMAQIMQELGVPENEVDQMIGVNPSYFAQMEILTKRIYMAPDFFVNLFTTPANVDRIGVTLQAIQLMNDRDRFESSLRREMLISMIVEMKLRAAERSVDNEVLGTIPSFYVK